MVRAHEAEILLSLNGRQAGTRAEGTILTCLKLN
jgi:hypothetical protein